MVTAAKLEPTDDQAERLKAFTAYDESSVKGEKAGFYSTCGQAFIRIE